MRVSSSDIGRLQSVLLVLALLLAQWLSFAHSLDHAGPLPEHDCGLCVAAMDLDTVVPVAAMSAATLWLGVEAPPALLAISAAPAPSPLQRARAPPEPAAA
ncbi:hypothetical protein [Hydrocarboniphaga sp.]|uniref:hypothetical protein n=1 Tax=Hydrocarboniphaga sp. TaxID=2033016 RepID=UPI003D138F2F